MWMQVLFTIIALIVNTFCQSSLTVFNACVDNIRMDFLELGWSDANWIGLALDRNRWRALVNSVLNLRVP
jgi:hypothetical protein